MTCAILAEGAGEEETNSYCTQPPQLLNLYYQNHISRTSEYMFVQFFSTTCNKQLVNCQTVPLSSTCLLYYTRRKYGKDCNFCTIRLVRINFQTLLQDKSVVQVYFIGSFDLLSRICSFSTKNSFSFLTLPIHDLVSKGSVSKTSLKQNVTSYHSFSLL